MLPCKDSKAVADEHQEGVSFSHSRHFRCCEGPCPAISGTSTSPSSPRQAVGESINGATNRQRSASPPPNYAENGFHAETPEKPSHSKRERLSDIYVPWESPNTRYGQIDRLVSDADAALKVDLTIQTKPLFKESSNATVNQGAGLESEIDFHDSAEPRSHDEEPFSDTSDSDEDLTISFEPCDNQGYKSIHIGRINQVQDTTSASVVGTSSYNATARRPIAKRRSYEGDDDENDGQRPKRNKPCPTGPDPEKDLRCIYFVAEPEVYNVDNGRVYGPCHSMHKTISSLM